MLSNGVGIIDVDEESGPDSEHLLQTVTEAVENDNRHSNSA